MRPLSSKYYSVQLLCTVLQNYLVTPVKIDEAKWSPTAGAACDLIQDQFLMVNPNTPNTYLQCAPKGRGTTGAWQIMPCPPGQTFQFGKQRCDFDLTSFVVQPENVEQNPKKRYKSSAPLASEMPEKIAYLNQPCNDSYCFGGSICNQTTYLCQCPAGTTAAQDSIYCHAPMDKVNMDPSNAFFGLPQIRSAAPGDSCRQGEICTGGSSCQPDSMTCACPMSTLNNRGICTMIAGIKYTHLGASCDGENILCPKGAQCTKGICLCIPPLIENRNACVSLKKDHAGLGDRCDSGQHCAAGSVCNSLTLRCACPLGTKQTNGQCTDTSSRKESLSNVGESCEINTDCANGAYCHSRSGVSLCECLTTHVEIDRTCFKVVHPGQQGCTYDKQCSAAYHGAVCRKNVCICPEGTVAIEQTCSTGEKINEKYPDIELSTLKPVQTGSPPGGSCGPAERCMGGSVCLEGTCACPEASMQVVDGHCIAAPTVGTTMLHVFNIEGRKTFVAAGSPCGNNVICVGGSVCVDAVCQCTKGLLQVNNKCVRDLVVLEETTSTALPPPPVSPTVVPQQIDIMRQPDIRCVTDDMCKGNSICINSECACPSGTVMVNNVCQVVPVNWSPTVISQAQHDSACLRDDQCNPGAVCVLGACQCPPTTRQMADGSCRSTSLGSPCTTDESCMGKSICINGRCRCAPDSIEQNDVCVSLNSELMDGTRWQNALAHTQCPNSMLPVVDPKSQDYLRCNSTAPQCPIGSYCFTSGGPATNAVHYCCPTEERHSIQLPARRRRVYY